MGASKRHKKRAKEKVNLELPGLSDDEPQDQLLDECSENVAPTPPAFKELLASPLVDEPLPDDFDIETEADHLGRLWSRCPGLWKYNFYDFVHAGGSGMVFEVTLEEKTAHRALKLARAALFEVDSTETEVPNALSPVPESELRALDILAHPHLVRLYDVLDVDGVVIGITTTYVADPTPLDAFIRRTLALSPSSRQKLHRFSPQRLEDACAFIAHRLLEVSKALAHMHAYSIFHFDLKPANILISGKKANHAILTDMGACIHAKELGDTEMIRVYFTWTYAHFTLQQLTSDPKGISGGGLKASAKVDKEDRLARYDLYAFGKTVLELLGILEFEFGERCYASYGFRFLHLIGALLLDGHNAPSRSDEAQELHGRYFVSDLAMRYPRQLFQRQKIKSAGELVARIERFDAPLSYVAGVPELGHWQPKSINLSVGIFAPFSPRIASIANHPAFLRLKQEPQLGWMKEVYPGATHTRWSHSLGVCANLASYYGALLSDPEIPTLRVMIDTPDVEHALVAGLLHDIGQSAFGHDFEAVNPVMFDHKSFVQRLLDDEFWGVDTLRKTVAKEWPNVDLERVLRILGVHKKEQKSPGEVSEDRPVDGVAVDMIDGPIDTDKFDYVYRDSQFCGVAYGIAVDRKRFLQSLSVAAIEGSGGRWSMGLAYKAKGRPAIESLLLARYQLYGAVYWHHTVRCIQAMFNHAVVSTFRPTNSNRITIRGQSMASTTITNLFYERVVCRKPWAIVQKLAGVKDRKLPDNFFEESSSVDAVGLEPAFDFLWRFADEPAQKLIELLAERALYKRIFELRVGSLRPKSDYSKMSALLTPEARVEKATDLQQVFFGFSLNNCSSYELYFRQGDLGAAEVDGGDEGVGGVEAVGAMGQETDLVVHALEAGVG